MHLDLEVFTKDACPCYIALSYVWGSYDDTKTVAIHHCLLAITKNLWDFLQVLHVNGRYTEQWFWADQISMDQQNIAERDHQVGLMGETYSDAERVFAYLGDKPNGSGSDEEGCLLDTWWPLGCKGRLNVLSTLDIFTRPYWTRLWIVQELRLAQEVIFWCGGLAITRSMLHDDYLRVFLSQKQVLSVVENSASTGAAELEEHARALFEHGIWTIRLLLCDHAGDVEKDLQAVLLDYRRTKCADPRDKIFGGQALVKPAQRVAVDYSKSLEELVREVLRVVIVRQPNATTEKFPSWTFTNHRVKQRIEDLSKFSVMLKGSAQPRCRDAEAMCWAHLVYRIPRHVRKIQTKCTSARIGRCSGTE